MNKRGQDIVINVKVPVPIRMIAIDVDDNESCDDVLADGRRVRWEEASGYSLVFNGGTT